MKFNANVTSLYPELSVMDGLEAAAADGFSAVECRMPYDVPVETISDKINELGLTFVQFNTPSGAWGQGERGIAGLPGRTQEFRDGLELAIDYARKLGVRQLNALAGLLPEGTRSEVFEDTLVANLGFAAKRLQDEGIRLQLEPVNSADIPGAYITTTGHFQRIYERVKSDNLFLQYDFYHMQVMQGDLVQTFARLQPYINHVQVADHPGRHEPGTGEINYRFVFETLERLGYDRWIGCEYVPQEDVGNGFRKWTSMLT